MSDVHFEWNIYRWCHCFQNRLVVNNAVDGAFIHPIRKTPRGPACVPPAWDIYSKLERSDIESSSSIHLRGLRTSCLESRYCDAWRCRLELEFVRYTWMQHRKWTLLLPSYVSRLCAFGCALPATVRKSKLFGLNGPGNGRERIDLPLLRRNACSKDSNRASRRDGKDLMVDYPRPCKGRLMVSALAEHRSIQSNIVISNPGAQEALMGQLCPPLPILLPWTCAVPGRWKPSTPSKRLVPYRNLDSFFWARLNFYENHF